ncbi:MAG: hypothetical protein HOP12_02040 [Candidatus Eisenbacteria bacterium]|uniref:Uncharacterized protein n=1 Tax=Eiseniibacteriota bacterium TaxID=2212470 RepID=A0A849SEM0_UNCEI|nr:hypothetical protein [Candidatus Eisenbacteria bacterium]
MTRVPDPRLLPSRLDAPPRARVAHVAQASITPRAMRLAFVLVLSLALALATAFVAHASEAVVAPSLPAGEISPADVWSGVPLTVEVDRIKPQKLKLPMLRFLKENRDFIRAQFDLLRQKPLEGEGLAADVDPRFLEWGQMLARILADRDSVSLADNERQRRELFASITELGQLEGQLDQMERLLAEQRGRLQRLQDDFTGDQRTALVVVLSGYPQGIPVSGVTVTLEDGARLTVPLTESQRTSLQQGGVVQVFHGFVEPREQVIQIALGAEAVDGSIGYVSLEPVRDRLTFLRLDLSTVRPDQGAPSIEATTWLHADRPHPIRG